VVFLPFLRYGHGSRHAALDRGELAAWTASCRASGKRSHRYVVVRSTVTEQINHDPAHTFMSCGTAISGWPSIGAWVTYGLGSEAKDLPGFAGA